MGAHQTGDDVCPIVALAGVAANQSIGPRLSAAPAARGTVVETLESASPRAARPGIDSWRQPPRWGWNTVAWE
jgi:hypothetical protein